MNSYFPSSENLEIENLEIEEKNFKNEKTKTSKLFKQLGSLAGAVTFCFGILPIAFEIYEHFKVIEQQKIENTFKFYERQFKEDNLQKSIEQIELFQAELDGKYPIIDNQATEEIKQLISRKEETQDNFIQHFLRVEDFYSGLLKCIDDQNCHENTVETLFKNDIREFISTFQPLICSKRKDWNRPDFGETLTRFSKNKLCSDS